MIFHLGSAVLKPVIAWLAWPCWFHLDVFSKNRVGPKIERLFQQGHRSGKPLLGSKVSQAVPVMDTEPWKEKFPLMNRQLKLSPLSSASIFKRNYYSNYILWAWVIFLFLKKYFTLPIFLVYFHFVWFGCKKPCGSWFFENIFKRARPFSSGIPVDHI